MSLRQGIGASARRGLAAAGVVVLGGLTVTAVHAQTLKRVVDRPVIERLAFDGNVNLSSGELQAAIATQASHCRAWVLCRVLPRGWLYKKDSLDRAELDRDLLRLRVLYWKRGWRAAQVTPVITKRAEGLVSIVLKIVEGPPTLIGAIDLGRLDSLLTIHGIQSLVDVRSGQPLDLIRLDSIASRIAGHLDEEGYGDMIVTPVAVADTSSPRAAVSFTVKGSIRHGSSPFASRAPRNTIRGSLRTRWA